MVKYTESLKLFRPFQQSEVYLWMDILRRYAHESSSTHPLNAAQISEMAPVLAASSEVHEIIRMLGELDHRVAFRTFLVEHDISEADYILWGCLKG